MTANATVRIPAPLTAEEFFERAPDGPCELVRGVVTYLGPAGSLHGNIAFRIVARIAGHLAPFID